MHINQRTKGYEYCTAEAMLLGMQYGWLTHVYFKLGVGASYIDAETFEPLNKKEVNQRGNDFFKTFKNEDYKYRINLALQYLKDYGPNP